MAYAFAGPLGLCVQEATQQTTRLLSSNARLQQKPARRSIDAPAFSAGSTPATSAAPGAARNAGSPSRQRPATTESQSTLWGLWGSLASRSSAYLKQLPRAFALTQQASDPITTANAQPTTQQIASEAPVSITATPSQAPSAKPLLHDFLAASDVIECEYASVMADLSDLAYDIQKLNGHLLEDRTGLVLVSTSHAVKEGPLSRDAWYAQVKESRQQSAEPAPPPPHIQKQHCHREPELSDAAAAVAHALVCGDLANTSPPAHDADVTLTPSVALVSVSSLEEPSPRNSVSGPEDAVIPIVTFTRSPPSSPRSSTSDLQHAPFAPEPQPSQPVVQLAAPALPGEMTSSQAAALTTSDEPPAAWFACDDPVTKIRHFVIQGSTSLEHWQINLQFEPVIFEDPALGVRIHRGVYMAALKLYDDLVPLVRQHLASSSFNSVTFTGHSLGGSLATVLMLLMVSRGVLPTDCVSPVYTFGAPAVFCGGAGAFSTPSRCVECGLDCPDARHAAQHPPSSCSKKPRGLFAQLGLGEEHIVNVIMHRDIVPRAFACDYMAVADLLVSWMPSFKSLTNLQGPANSHKSLYSFLGRVAVLQPDPSCPFVQSSDAKHPHLPAAPGLYRLVAPAPKLRVHALHGTFDLPIPTPSAVPNVSDSMGPYTLGGTLLDESAMIANMATLGRPRPYTPAPFRFATVEEDDDADTTHPVSRGRRHRRKSPMDNSATQKATEGGVVAPTTLKEAVLHFMNHPHPLTTLTEYAAYGPNGSISRYHNPRNYTLGLLALIGKAPHQQRASPVPDLPTTSMPLPPPPTTAAAPHVTMPADKLRDPQETPASHELEVISPEARRLIRMSSPSPARARATSRSHKTSTALTRRSVGSSHPAHSAEPRAAASKAPATSRLPPLPALSSLPASLSSLLGYKAVDTAN